MHKIVELDDYQLRNREKAQRIGKAKFWCNGCDAELVGEVGKCSVCGCINTSGKRLKKMV